MMFSFLFFFDILGSSTLSVQGEHSYRLVKAVGGDTAWRGQKQVGRLTGEGGSTTKKQTCCLAARPRILCHCDLRTQTMRLNRLEVRQVGTSQQTVHF